MVSLLQNAARHSMRASLHILERLKGVDLALFYLVMVVKLYFFHQFINVRNMELMTMDDFWVALGTLGLITFWTLWLPIRGRITALVILNLILTFILYADLIYYRYFQDLISVPVLLQAGQVGSLGDSIGELIKAADIGLFADWPFIVPFAIYILISGKSARNKLQSARARRLPKLLIRFTLGLAVGAISLALVLVPIDKATKTWAQGLFVGNWWNVSLYNVTGLYGFHGYDIYRFVDQRWLSKEKLGDTEIAETEQWIKNRGEIRRGLEQDPLFGQYAGSNVIMIQAEALQNFMIGKSYNNQEITPNFNRFMKESAYFSHFYHQTALGRTSDADFTAHCSMHPVSTGSVFIQYSQHEFNCSPALLKENGYHTAVYHAYDGGFWNRNAMYSAMKYDTFVSKKNFIIDEAIGWSLGDKSFFRQSLDLISKQQEPFYSFLITLTSHHPYKLPKEIQQLDLGDMNDTLFGDYLQSVHYVDAAFGELVERLKAEGLWDTSILLIYGDHDNSIREWEPFEKFLGQPLSPLDRQQILKQVPLLIHLPDGAHAGVYGQAGGQTDLAPTLLHLLGISSADKAMIGTPLLTERPLAGKSVVFRNGAYTDGTHYFVPSGDGVIENGTCYELATGEPGDPAACKAGAEKAREELRHSDRVVEHNLISEFR
ncbi:sulfatase [Paenibacillus abyssi]|uniref:Sulfatase n=2 Tax=Paenibacillus abyssi TaxID=1340531 RepID=A0A917FZS4_9BACL|nr:sulfatase [Paenibacillus abyssi]